jgi:hypothetical protein
LDTCHRLGSWQRIRFHRKANAQSSGQSIIFSTAAPAGLSSGEGRDQNSIVAHTIILKPHSNTLIIVDESDTAIQFPISRIPEPISWEQKHILSVL